jgi:hypothetical protein
MKRKLTDYNQAIQLFVELKKLYPTYTLGQHIATALSDYGDAWGISDKELVFALEKYRAELEYNIVSDIEVEKIVKDAQDLNKLMKDEEGEDDYD